MSFKSLGYSFYTRPIKFTQFFAREYPSYFWSVVVGIGAPAGFAAYPYVREYFDPPASEVEPTWYRHVPPPSVREAIEAQGISWDEAVKELAARRDAMVEGEEWDISYENGKVTWKKPSEATIKERYESQIDLREWGLGWRKAVVWTIWKMLGSPEGVFEYEGGKLDGKLVLRELVKEKKGGLKELEKKEEKS